MTATGSPPPVPAERSHEVWARTIQGALQHAQHIAQQRLSALAESADPVVRKAAQRAREVLEDADAAALTYADALLAKAGAEATPARLSIVTQYECRTQPRGRPPKDREPAHPIHEIVEPEEWPVWIRLLNAQGEPVSGPIWVDDPPAPQAEEAPLPLSFEEHKRRYDAAAKQKQRDEQGMPEVSRGRALAVAMEELRAARADWDQILEGLAGNPASKLLSGHGLPRRLDKAIACVEEASRVEAPGKRGPGRPPGELGKARKVWEARNAEIRADYDANMAFAELETKYGITEESMRVYMKQAGWPMRGTRGPARQKRTATSGPLRPSPGVKPKQPAAKKTGKKR